MVEPATAAIAVLSTIAGVSGYGAMKINSNQARVMDETANRLAAGKIEKVRQELAIATEQMKAKAEKELQAKQAEVDQFKRDIEVLQKSTEGERLFRSVSIAGLKKAIKTLQEQRSESDGEKTAAAVKKVFDNYTSSKRLRVSRGSLNSLYNDLTKAAEKPYMDREEFYRTLTDILRSVDASLQGDKSAAEANKTETPAESTTSPDKKFLDNADMLLQEADLREKELNDTEKIIAERLKEAEADKSTEGQITIKRLQKAIKTTTQAKERVVTARNKFKDTRDSYKKEADAARKTLRARRIDPEDKAAAESILRLPPTDIREEVTSTLDKAGAVNVEMKTFLEGKSAEVPTLPEQDVMSLDENITETKSPLIEEQDRQRKEERKKEELAQTMDSPVKISKRSKFSFSSAQSTPPTVEPDSVPSTPPTVEPDSVPSTPRTEDPASETSTPRAAGLRKKKLRTRRGGKQRKHVRRTRRS